MGAGPCKKGQALELAHESPPRGPTILAQTSDAVANKIDQDDKPIPQKLISPTSTSPESRPKQTEMQQHDLQERAKVIKQHFPKALALDDFISRAEVALAGYGFTGANSIAMSNLCRDESCIMLENRIESVFGSCFSTHGLGGVLTCGVVGIKAGLSHSPIAGGKEQYVFFSFPHIAIDSAGEVGKISRPNRPGASCACGALNACLGSFKAEGLDVHCKGPGVHDPLDPELSILKQRLARRLRHEKKDVKELDLVGITQAAERTITSDLEYLIEKAVDPSKANYAVFTGVQIHNWAADVNTDAGAPSLEFISVGKSYVVINGERTYLDVSMVPSLAPRQLQLLAAASAGLAGDLPSSNSVVQEIPRSVLMRCVGGATGRSAEPVALSKPSDGWQQFVKTDFQDIHPNAPKMDDKDT
eukprot:CAMPEP_0202374188 /NCGR_PEP_ID=MMETSP1127-20130417/5069_1 /ASSEMBLY_ACC=CAM_ASM_000462 /TAXON_ID=3047 /ORGANISM="Dunaliella tertiolecta, Strain CCMP1320" /LENGTH=415 /DNA_ID=CAMNT_0048971285 /DNA_START=57 /DNA_END=1304 /DNA_ORIENTATION=-